MKKYENNLWGKVDFLHNRYYKLHFNVNNYIEMLSKFQLAFQTFSKSIDSISTKNFQIYSEKKYSLYPVIGSIPKNISIHSKEFNEMSEFIKSKIIDQAKISLNETYLKENSLYQNYIKSKKNYKNMKIDLEKSKNNFNDNAKICENLMVNAKSMKYNNSSSKKDIEKNEIIVNEKLSNVVSYENKYIEYLNETNKNREELNKKELDLLNLYEEIDKDIVIKIKGMICMYIAGLKKMYSTLLADLTWINNQFKKINSENDTNLFLNKYKSNFHKDEKIPFVPYKPKSSLDPSVILSTGDLKKDENILDINLEVISSLKNNLKNVCSNINLEAEGKKKRLRYLTSKVFKTNTDFKDEEKKELLEYIKEISLRNYFLIMLSKQRTKGVYSKNKKLIDDLSDLLNVILDYSEKEKDYEGAKNCLILSQTYYYEMKKDNKRYKYYLFNNIKNNKWLNSIEFWERLIEIMIEKEIKNNEKTNINYKLGEKYKKNALSNIGFSQLVTYSQNMIEFGIPKENILAICKKFIDKYQVKKGYAETIINNINNSTKMTFFEEIVEEEDQKIEINPKRKKSFSKENNGDENFDDFFPNSVKNKSNINLMEDDKNKIDKNDKNDDSNYNKINIINDNNEDEK